MRQFVHNRISDELVRRVAMVLVILFLFAVAGLGTYATVVRAQPADSTATPSPAASENYLTWSIRSLGWTYSLAFLFISFNLIALVAMMILALRRENICPGDLADEFTAHLDQQQVQTAYDLARNDESFLGQVLAAGLVKVSGEGYDEAIKAMHEVGEAEVMKLEHRLSYIALIGKISPMVGLLGTVHGMVMAFQVIATSNSTPEPAKLADGIATALMTTLVGLMIAIPAVSVHDMFRNRITRLVMEVGSRSEELMVRFRTRNGSAKS
ncbi:MAG: MotA/TolQ/ExbB proton channel family protein [Planctomycetota bacterium]|nr:MotA/TolQ/ExbB proton channel family protein [Planctomycetota bacterium]